jgi:hypothetical protein
MNDWLKNKLATLTTPQWGVEDMRAEYNARTGENLTLAEYYATDEYQSQEARNLHAACRMQQADVLANS